jgi:RNA polymerase sigma factor (TIGR02999 family)
MNEQITRLLAAVDQGNKSAAQKLLPLVYDDLRRLAASRMAMERGNHTLQPTALVHEAYLRLAENSQEEWKSRGHYFAAAAEAMRRILVDRARAKAAMKRGGRFTRVDLEDVQLAIDTRPDILCALNDAMDELSMIAPQKAELVKLRFFVGMTNKEAAEALDVSLVTVKRHWEFARAWLFQRLENLATDPADNE